jgi:uncharacterized PurR-regulated membrane protein YhhQ (DUF165 family)
VTGGLGILLLEALVAYFLVLGAHALRHRVGLAYFHALIGGLTPVMSWVTDAGVVLEVAGIRFVVGSTVFYTSLLLGVFVVYVFDGPPATRVAISTVAIVSALVPLIAYALHLQAGPTGEAALARVPMPSLRINVASVVTTVADLVFLAVTWEFLGTPRVRAPLWLRAFLTLLGVMWLDVGLFATGAFLGAPAYLRIMAGTFVSRTLISLFAFPFLYLYLEWQRSRARDGIGSRPVLAILQEVTRVRAELTQAQREIARRRQVEAEKEGLIEDLRRALSEVKTLRGFLPICASCKKIRDDAGYWQQLERYLQDHSEAVFSHGICPDCAKRLYPDQYRSP